MTLSTIGSDIFIGDSAATSHMTNNKTGVYNLKPIRGSVMIGNGESISCTHEGNTANEINPKLPFFTLNLKSLG